ncbi:helix-turn-helix transcriptional regulator [Paenibacillus sp. IB182496]|uniref:Helix-turn-helix transcriptional regulator n=1 Tax=Paenibacillus sabuli TaxID=2772509 RepID=A0A927BTH0_9BACL|nr:AraC family transcriptional regulator [Paenibacillus sabuli]MBD2846491.1 helix-turn-helix transcriptional regulator [Paenibacillus sabuli]
MTRQPVSLREEMSMPDPQFPVKLHHTRFSGQGVTLFPPHWHRHFELLRFVTGEARIECNSKPCHVRAGDIVAINSNDLHHGVCLSEDLRYEVLIVDLELLQSRSLDAAQTKYLAPVAHNQILFRNHIAADEALHETVTALARELQDRPYGYELSVKSLLYRLFAQLLRGYVATWLTESQSRQRLRNLERFAPVFGHIEAHYADTISIETLAGLAGLSRYHFSRLFKELTGRTVSDYITRTRLLEADHLLRNSDLSITEIALATGFGDLSYFSRAYKRYNHAAPSDIRRRS